MHWFAAKYIMRIVVKEEEKLHIFMKYAYKNI